MACVLAFILVELLGSKFVRSISTVGGTNNKVSKFSVNSVTTFTSLAGIPPQQGES